MARRYDAKQQSDNALRELLDDESTEGKIHLAGIALSYATGMTEPTARDAVSRIISLRMIGTTDPQINIRLNLPGWDGRLR